MSGWGLSGWGLVQGLRQGFGVLVGCNVKSAGTDS